MEEKKGPAWLTEEKRRIALRRKTLEVAPPDATKDNGDKAWGLTLSGGGIRSATFSLGLMQALARTEMPGSGERAPPGGWMRCFDYLSTVSGGGYIGAFFVSLFVPQRLVAGPWKPRTVLTRVQASMRPFRRGDGTRARREAAGSAENVASAETGPAAQAEEADKAGANDQKETSRDAADRAYEVLRDDPPGRIRSSDGYDPLRKPLAWLRENGRYLTPTGAGDFLYAIALAIRNWCSVHYVIGTALLVLFALVVPLKLGVASVLPSNLGATCVGFFAVPPWAQSDATCPSWWFWWSPLWALVLAVTVLWVVPSGLAFWLIDDRETRAQLPEERLGFFTTAALFDIFVVAVLALVLWFMPSGDGSTADGGLGNVKLAVCLALLVTTLGLLFHAGAVSASAGPEVQRVAQTRCLTAGLKVVLLLAVVAAVDTLGQTSYLWLKQSGSPSRDLLASTGFLSGLVWAIRAVATSAGGKGKRGWLSALPLDLVLGMVAAVLLLGVASAWAVLAQWFIWQGGTPKPIDTATFRVIWPAVAWLGGIATLLAWINGRFPDFINLSTLQAFYGQRLTRAYLGATNGARFTGPDNRRWNSAAEPHPDDPIARARYFSDDVCAPAHLINITMDQTVDPAEQLVQRDRKGRPLAVGPAGYLLDGEHHEYTTGEADFPIGEWIGVSAAAFTTGLGRSTTLGTSLLLGLANVRLGVWWNSGFGKHSANWLERLLLWALPTQTYLRYELSGQFYGDHRKWQYLSDGGHFENTAAYELLRPERRISVIVTSDNGCDEMYHFEDLANLIRLSRIDHGAHFDLVSGFPPDLKLGEVFGTQKDFDKKNADRTNTCALLYRVTYPGPDGTEKALARWLIVVKPRLVAAAPLDVWQYHEKHKAFPQETTADQFFDEAQWESYRKLGLVIGTLIFRDHGADLLGAISNKVPPSARAPRRSRASSRQTPK